MKYIPLFFLLVLPFFFQLNGDNLKKLIASGNFKNEEQYKKHCLNELKKTQFVTKKGEKLDLALSRPPVIVLNFWATWCGPCLQEFPSLKKFRSLYPKKDVGIYAINGDLENQEKNIDAIMRKYKLNFDIILDKKTSLFEQYNIEAVPVSIIIFNNKVEFISQGAFDFIDKSFLKKVSKAVSDSKLKK